MRGPSIYISLDSGLASSGEAEDGKMIRKNPGFRSREKTGFRSRIRSRTGYSRNDGEEYVKTGLYPGFTSAFFFRHPGGSRGPVFYSFWITALLIELGQDFNIKKEKKNILPRIPVSSMGQAQSRAGSRRNDGEKESLDFSEHEKRKRLDSGSSPE